MPIWNFEIPSGTTPVLALDLSSLSITVSPGAGGRVTVDADESLAPLIAVGADGTTISIRQVALVGRERLAGIWAWTSEQSRVHVTMPAWSRLEARMDLGSLSAKQPWEDAWVRASAGSVKLGECRTASVRADAGTVWVAALGSGEIFTQAGSVKVGTVTGAVTASASAGSVKVMEAREGSLDLRTELGSISVGVPFGTAVLVDCSSAMGRVITELPERDAPSDPELRLELRARTELGTVRLRRA